MNLVILEISKSTKTIIGVLLVIALAVLFVLGFVLNHKTKAPDGCKVNECEGCKIASCGLRKNKEEQKEEINKGDDHHDMD